MVLPGGQYAPNIVCQIPVVRALVRHRPRISKMGSLSGIHPAEFTGSMVAYWQNITSLAARPVSWACPGVTSMGYQMGAPATLPAEEFTGIQPSELMS